MQNVLADLALEAEAAMTQSLRMARALVRIGTTIDKYWIRKRTPSHAYEAMECIGGSGVMESTPMPRLYREAPINTVWEGSGNVQCLDVLRAVQKEPDTLEVFMAEVARGKGGNTAFDRYLEGLQSEFRDPSDMEYRARGVVAKMAMAFQASLLIRAGNDLISDAFCASRLGEDSGRAYGMLPRGIDCSAIIERARPDLG
jgi:putative acyl-CoA dehydrogenase